MVQQSEKVIQNMTNSGRESIFVEVNESKQKLVDFKESINQVSISIFNDFILRIGRIKNGNGPEASDKQAHQINNLSKELIFSKIGAQASPLLRRMTQKVHLAKLHHFIKRFFVE